MNCFKKVSLWITVLFLFVSASFSIVPNTANAAENDPLGLKAEAAILIDAETGAILYEKNADVVLGVASMSKMMTEYLVLEAIKEGTISWDQEVTISEYIHKLSSPNMGLSNIGLTQGEKYTIEELYQAMAVYSANAATSALAEVVGGTEKNFVKLMNKKAEELNLGEFKFVNASGLNNKDLLGNHPTGEPNEENVMSAKATARLAFHLLKDFPEVLETAKIPKLKFKDGREYPNFNWMLPGLSYEYPGVDGLKTGSTDFAGYGFTATAKKGDNRFISVVMKSSTREERFTETRKLLEYAFNNHSKVEIVAKGAEVEGHKSLPVTKGKEDSVKIETADAIEMVVKNGEQEKYETVLTLDKKKLNEDGELTAPIKKGDKIGSLTVKPKEGDSIEFLTENGTKSVTVDVVASEDVEKANWFVLSMRAIGGFFGDIWGSVSSTVKGWF
ncbi:D-alanyl-D-alanine carboxypeptidase family protein [Niallia sp. Krafla_26]|uniref:D-alanyl-D-alanine carboxypeptidase family protein n=1 Tax=Niallia sp. Krafla_26 TaxID=3064703 RepID=UPI003D17553A